MTCPDEAPEQEAYGAVELTDSGRLPIPKALREDLRLDAGSTFTVIREGTDIRLVRQFPELHTLTAEKSREEWRDDAFRDTGEATFGGR